MKIGGFAMLFMLTTGIAAAQAGDTASTICGTSSYNTLLALFYVIMGLSIAGIVTSAVTGAGLKSFGWISRSVSQAGNKALAGSLGGMLVLAVVLAIMGVAYGNVSVSIPAECAIPL
ncbi:hypothetical protein OB920_05220 [Halobacteria archaeon HArc-gm2]|nr:hypothetical protein [Halobacteria archaeon HArc-gm2]